MKLNPPGSSSDLDTARAIARRLHQRAFESEAIPTVVARRQPWEVPPPARDPLPTHRPADPAAGARVPAPARRERPPDPEPELDLPPSGAPDLHVDLDSSLSGTNEGPGAGNEAPPDPDEMLWDGGERDSRVEPDDALAALAGEAHEFAAGVSPEDLVSEPDMREPDAPEPAWSEPSPFEVESSEPTRGEDFVEVPGPSWDDVTETCLGIAHAHAAMLVDAGGRVLAARGDWPNPGPEAIAARLVPMMERALREAPTRSVSAPLAGQHLTAWRARAGEALLTAVFMGDAPLRADVRPAIDEEIGRSAGS